MLEPQTAVCRCCLPSPGGPELLVELLAPLAYPPGSRLIDVG